MILCDCSQTDFKYWTSTLHSEWIHYKRKKRETKKLLRIFCLLWLIINYCHAKSSISKLFIVTWTCEICVCILQRLVINVYTILNMVVNFRWTIQKLQIIHKNQKLDAIPNCVLSSVDSTRRFDMCYSYV